MSSSKPAEVLEWDFDELTDSLQQPANRSVANALQAKLSNDLRLKVSLEPLLPNERNIAVANPCRFLVAAEEPQQKELPELKEVKKLIGDKNLLTIQFFLSYPSDL